MAIIHRTTLTPTKLELLTAWLPGRPWYRGGAGEPRLARAGGFRLDDPEGEVSLRMSDLGDRVEIAVTDCGPGFGQALQRAGSDAGEPRGRGLQVVRSLVDEVSVHRHGHETTVHCVVYRF